MTLGGSVEFHLEELRAFKLLSSLIFDVPKVVDHRCHTQGEQYLQIRQASVTVLCSTLTESSICSSGLAHQENSADCKVQNKEHAANQLQCNCS